MNQIHYYVYVYWSTKMLELILKYSVSPELLQIANYCQWNQDEIRFQDFMETHQPVEPILISLK